MNALACDIATTITLKRAEKTGGGPLFARVAVQLAQHGAEDMRKGFELARAAVKALKGARDFDPAVYGATDDEVADHLLAAAVRRRKEKQKQGSSAAPATRLSSLGRASGLNDPKGDER